MTGQRRRKIGRQAREDLWTTGMSLANDWASDLKSIYSLFFILLFLLSLVFNVKHNKKILVRPHLQATEDSWSRILPSPSNIVSSVSLENWTLINWYHLLCVCSLVSEEMGEKKNEIRMKERKREGREGDCGGNGDVTWRTMWLQWLTFIWARQACHTVWCCDLQWIVYLGFWV